ncbi:class I SAM-dependent methyltransferase, partial [Cohnella sp. GbtcB17]|uniref:class I SAM-dependent methyltransferase n=1 Tax=Cohnella sp. GbtcB17 TaxID=2824762 RepID=UPI0020C6DAE0
MPAAVQRLPFHEDQFDLVHANNRLYHVADLPLAVEETHRVLKPGGLLCASTMRTRHLQKMEDIAVSFNPDLRVLDQA